MSYILDALRKSEQERQRGTVGRPGGPVHDVSLPWRGGWLLVIGVILLLFLLAAAVIYLHSPDRRISSEAAVAATPPSVVPTAVSPASEAIAVAPPPVAEVKKESPVRDLEEQTQVPVPVISKKPGNEPRRKAAAIMPRHSSQADGPDVLLETDNTPLLQQMPPEMQRAIPPMTVTIHVYSPQESQRILFINNREYHKGNLIEGGARVEAIVPDGVVLSYQGERFKLPRPR